MQTCLEWRVNDASSFSKFSCIEYLLCTRHFAARLLASVGLGGSYRLSDFLRATCDNACFHGARSLNQVNTSPFHYSTRLTISGCHGAVAGTHFTA